MWCYCVYVMVAVVVLCVDVSNNRSILATRKTLTYVNS